MVSDEFSIRWTRLPHLFDALRMRHCTIPIYERAHVEGTTGTPTRRDTRRWSHRSYRLRGTADKMRQHVCPFTTENPRVICR